MIDKASEAQKSSMVHVYKQIQATPINDTYYYDVNNQGGYVVLYPRYFISCPRMTDVHWQNAETVQGP